MKRYLRSEAVWGCVFGGLVMATLWRLSDGQYVIAAVDAVASVGALIKVRSVSR